MGGGCDAVTPDRAKARAFFFFSDALLRGTFILTLGEVVGLALRNREILVAGDAKLPFPSTCTQNPVSYTLYAKAGRYCTLVV